MHKAFHLIWHVIRHVIWYYTWHMGMSLILIWHMPGMLFDMTYDIKWNTLCMALHQIKWHAYDTMSYQMTYVLWHYVISNGIPYDIMSIKWHAVWHVISHDMSTMLPMTYVSNDMTYGMSYQTISYCLILYDGMRHAPPFYKKCTVPGFADLFPLPLSILTALQRSLAGAASAKIIVTNNVTPTFSSVLGYPAPWYI